MSIKILVVDDSASDRLMIEKMLGEYDILTACDGLEAMRMLAEYEGINLMILDLDMPEMNGFQVLETIKLKEKLRKLRTIILTNYDELDNEIKGLKLGAIDFIRKPIRSHSLKARIEIHVELIRNQQALEQRIIEQSATFDTILNQVPLGIAISHDKGEISNGLNEHFKINPAYEKITGRTKEELLNVGLVSITHPDDMGEELINYARLKSGEIRSFAMDKRIIRPDGSMVWVHMFVAPIVLPESSQFNYISLIEDIGTNKIIEKKLVESERSKSALLSHFRGMSYKCSYDPQWTMQYVSSGCFELTGYPVESLIHSKDLSYNDLIAPEYRDTLWEEWKGAVTARVPFQREYEIITAEGVRKWVLEIGQGLYNDQDEVEVLEGVVIDITERKKMETTLRYYNEYDTWTGLHNRRSLQLMLEEDRKLHSTEKRAVISVNLSAIYSLSVVYGFQYSQDLIKSIAEELKPYRSDQCILFRTYEYRFVFYKKGYKDSQELLMFCRSVSSTLTSLLTIERINVGIGVMEVDDENKDDVDLLLKKLLVTSEEAIIFGGEENNISFYDQELEEKIFRREMLQRGLSQIAAGENEDQLFLLFQPILELNENRICGFEALARYKNDQLGLVPPMEFIPLIEKTKHIIPIGDIIIKKACQFIHKLKSSGYDTINVAINISIIQLLSKGFVENLLNTITTMGVNPEHIVLELTESVFSSNLDEINRRLGLLSRHGIKSSIDDFGTGYSSLSRERELNVNCIKIHKSFIDRLLYNKPDETITGDIISMAHKLGHCVVAEGVEYEKQMNYLKAHGCDKIQGYLISKPLNEELALAFLQRVRKSTDCHLSGRQ